MTLRTLVPSYLSRLWPICLPVVALKFCRMIHWRLWHPASRARTDVSTGPARRSPFTTLSGACIRGLMRSHISMESATSFSELLLISTIRCRSISPARFVSPTASNSLSPAALKPQLESRNSKQQAVAPSQPGRFSAVGQLPPFLYFVPILSRHDIGASSRV